ncbi:MAG: phosphoribosylaminoimidazolesuccinocarboxamide synthase [Patescibacteria group bacterium]|nr:phosphoribosylaminoimidazolesuccinocarboxamide synthase [Patescibacteria group bacterium]
MKMEKFVYDGGLLGTNLEIPGAKSYNGKTSDVYILPAGTRLKSMQILPREGAVLRIFCDRVSGNNKRFTPAIPGQGRLLADLLAYWSPIFERLGIATHFISNDIRAFFGKEDWYDEELAERSALCFKVDILGVENIARHYMRDTGSGRKQYLEDGTICGIKLPAGINPGEVLPGGPLWTPTYKSDKDPWIVKDKVIEEFGNQTALALEQNALLLQLAVNGILNPLGLIVPDNKTEWGIDARGRLLLADEYFSPHAATFWVIRDLMNRKITSLDKDPIRRWSDANPDETVLPNWLVEEMVNVYSTVRKMILGEAA